MVNKKPCCVYEILIAVSIMQSWMGHHIVWYTGTTVLGEPAVCIFSEVCSSAQKPVAACFSKTLVISTKVHHVTSWKNMILTHLSFFFLVHERG